MRQSLEKAMDERQELEHKVGTEYAMVKCKWHSKNSTRFVTNDCFSRVALKLQEVSHEASQLREQIADEHFAKKESDAEV